MPPRVHVERSIERLRRFGIMKFIRHTMYKHFNKVLIILAFTVNNFGPLIRDKNCMYEHVENEEDLTEQDINEILKEFENEFEHEDENEFEQEDMMS